jgi:hypothetical protein
MFFSQDNIIPRDKHKENVKGEMEEKKGTKERVGKTTIDEETNHSRRHGLQKNTRNMNVLQGVCLMNLMIRTY